MGHQRHEPGEGLPRGTHGAAECRELVQPGQVVVQLGHLAARCGVLAQLGFSGRSTRQPSQERQQCAAFRIDSHRPHEPQQLRAATLLFLQLQPRSEGKERLSQEPSLEEGHGRVQLSLSQSPFTPAQLDRHVVQTAGREPCPEVPQPGHNHFHHR